MALEHVPDGEVLVDIELGGHHEQAADSVGLVGETAARDAHGGDHERGASRRCFSAAGAALVIEAAVR